MPDICISNADYKFPCQPFIARTQDEGWEERNVTPHTSQSSPNLAPQVTVT